MQQALSGRIGKRLIILLAHGQYKITPCFDPLGIKSEKKALHKRCSALRRVLYRLVGVEHVDELRWGAVDGPFELLVDRVQLPPSRANPWRLVPVDDLLIERVTPNTLCKVRLFACGRKCASHSSRVPLDNHATQVLMEELNLSEHASDVLLDLLAEVPSIIVD